MEYLLTGTPTDFLKVYLRMGSPRGMPRAIPRVSLTACPQTDLRSVTQTGKPRDLHWDWQTDWPTEILMVSPPMAMPTD